MLSYITGEDQLTWHTKFSLPSLFAHSHYSSYGLFSAGRRKARFGVGAPQTTQN